MISKVGIVNIGLTAIGATNIVSFDQGSKNANFASTVYEDLRRNMLSYSWNFATSRVKLARSSTVPTYEFKYAYVLPADWIYTRSVHDNNAGVGTLLYKQEQVNEQNVILADAEDVYLRYVVDEQNPQLMPADFRYALSMAIARDAAIPIANSNTLYATYEKIARQTLNKAKSTDSLGSTPERRPVGSWVKVRNGLRSNSVRGT